MRERGEGSRVVTGDGGMGKGRKDGGESSVMKKGERGKGGQ